jgi:C-terminal processing protease CtpA/Prc
MTNKTNYHAALTLLLTLVLLSLTAVTSSAQKANKLEIEHWREVLRSVERELKETYYDPTFNGIDIAARFNTADAKMKNAASMADLERIVAQVLLDFDDTHTFFIPPDDGSSIQYGWRLKPVGPDCYVGAVKRRSDAWAKGLRPGDKVLSIDGRLMDRDRIWLANYRNYTLEPGQKMTLVIQKPDQTQRQLTIKANESRTIGDKMYTIPVEMRLKTPEELQSSHQQFYELSDEVMVWKMPELYLDEYDLADKFRKLKNRKVLILDLRGNNRGLVDALPHLAGYFFDSNVKLADRRGRKDLKPIVAKSKKENTFKGQLIVLIDGESASSAEIFAHAVQLYKRGVVIGDRSSGSVMEGRLYPMQVGIMRAIPVAISATYADVIMADGTKLERVGVTPDELILPSPQEMSLGHDPVLAHAASLAGITLDPKKAGGLFLTSR